MRIPRIYQPGALAPQQSISLADEPANHVGRRDIYRDNDDRFRLFCPDETNSNRLGVSVGELTAEQKRQGVMEMVRASFKPEFLNRLDDVVIFDALDRAELGAIVELNIDRLTARLQDRRLTLAVTPAARAWLAENGYDPIYGARPLRRTCAQDTGFGAVPAIGDAVPGRPALSPSVMRRDGDLRTYGK